MADCDNSNWDLIIICVAVTSFVTLKLNVKVVLTFDHISQITNIALASIATKFPINVTETL